MQSTSGVGIEHIGVLFKVCDQCLTIFGTLIGITYGIDLQLDIGNTELSPKACQIVMLARLLRELGIGDVELQINTIGDADERS